MMVERRHQSRDWITGQYQLDGNFDRMCACGHSLGNHVDGGWDCISTVIDHPGTPPCPCVKFRPSKRIGQILPKARQTRPATIEPQETATSPSQERA